MNDQELELRNEIEADVHREVIGQFAENQMYEHWERSYGDE